MAKEKQESSQPKLDEVNGGVFSPKVDSTHLNIIVTNITSDNYHQSAEDIVTACVRQGFKGQVDILKNLIAQALSSYVGSATVDVEVVFCGADYNINISSAGHSISIIGSKH